MTGVIGVKCSLIKQYLTNVKRAKYNKTQLKPIIHDGETANPSETILKLEGDAKTILMLERTALNFLRHLSAIATLTHEFVEKVKNTPLKILDTRKTTPGLRQLEKYAVSSGGGLNHRMGLYDAIMIKDTYVDLMGDMKSALAKLPKDILKKVPVIVEVRNEKELEEVLKAGKGKVSRVLLDNMTPEQLTQCTKICNKKVETEASGNVNLETIKAIAQTGVNYASIGKLTHSAGTVDLSMKATLTSP